jgi:hypothetical protein
MTNLVIEPIDYKKWGKCVRVSDGNIEAVATTEIGPRIIYIGFKNKQNLFCEFEEQSTIREGSQWHIFGGHRLWHSPENKPRTYFPDNSPVEWREIKDGIVLVQNVEEQTGIRKKIKLQMEPSNSCSVVHYLTNEGLWPVKIAAWCLSVMAPGGYAVVPHPTEHEPQGLLPNRLIVLWPYTDMKDKRVDWGTKFITVKQDENSKTPFKFGTMGCENWGAYVHKNGIFIKTYKHDKQAIYHDFGCSLEVYTNSRMLELETVGPIVELQPNQTIEHTENWKLVSFKKGIEPEDISALCHK